MAPKPVLGLLIGLAVVVAWPAAAGCSEPADEGPPLKANELPKAAKEVTADFEDAETGQTPAGFIAALTGGGGPGSWAVVEDDTAPAGGKVLAQTSKDKTSKRYPVCVYDSFSARDADVSVRFRPVSGEVDQAAGIVWRYKDKDNYYVVRANALEGNVVLYKTEGGVRTDLKLKGKTSGYGMKAQVPKDEWSTLRVTAVDDLFEVFVNGKKLYEVQDGTFTDAGKVGVWTKADSVTHFDDLRAASLDRKEEGEEDRGKK